MSDDNTHTSKSLLITVGTTGFDSLIAVACSEEFAKTLARLGFTTVFMQYGSSISQYDDTCFSKHGIRVIAFDYCESLSDYIRPVNLVIGHAGAGTILDTLRLKRPLIAVVNETLMGNHQHEIADAMVEKNYILKATPSTLISVLDQFPSAVLTPYPDAQPQVFASFLDKLMNFVLSVCYKSVNVPRFCQPMQQLSFHRI